MSDSDHTPYYLPASLDKSFPPSARSTSSTAGMSYPHLQQNQQQLQQDEFSLQLSETTCDVSDLTPDSGSSALFAHYTCSGELFDYAGSTTNSEPSLNPQQLEQYQSPMGSSRKSLTRDNLFDSGSTTINQVPNLYEGDEASQQEAETNYPRRTSLTSGIKDLYQDDDDEDAQETSSCGADKSHSSQEQREAKPVVSILRKSKYTNDSIASSCDSKRSDPIMPKEETPTDDDDHEANDSLPACTNATNSSTQSVSSSGKPKSILRKSRFTIKAPIEHDECTETEAETITSRMNSDRDLRENKALESAYAVERSLSSLTLDKSPAMDEGHEDVSGQDDDDEFSVAVPSSQEMELAETKERTYLALQWYNRCGMPSRKVFKKRIQSMILSSPNSEIQLEDVDLLPWKANGSGLARSSFQLMAEL